MSRRFSSEQDDILIDLISKYGAIYDSEHEDYKNASIREDIWNMIANAVGKNVDHCKKRWRDIRDNYFRNKSKLQKMRACSTSLRSPKWPLFENLSFLDVVKRESRLQHQNAEGSLGLELCEVFPETITDEMESNFIRLVKTEENESSSSRIRKRKGEPLDGMQQTSNRRFREGLLETTTVVEESIEDDVDLFMKSMAMTIKNLPPQQIAKAKINILSIVTELQFPSSS